MIKGAIVGSTMILLLTTTPLVGQVCVGTPVADGGKMIGGRVLFFDGGTRFGGMGTINPVGPLSFDANVDLIDPDAEGADMGFGIEGRGIYEVPDLEIPICPVGGLSFFTIEDLDVFGIVLGGAIGTATTLTPNSDLILHALPQLIVSRASIDNEFVDHSETESDFALELGGTITGERLFGTLLVIIADEDAFGFRVGILN